MVWVPALARTTPDRREQRARSASNRRAGEARFLFKLENLGARGTSANISNR